MLTLNQYNHNHYYIQTGSNDLKDVKNAVKVSRFLKDTGRHKIFRESVCSSTWWVNNNRFGFWIGVKYNFVCKKNRTKVICDLKILTVEVCLTSFLYKKLPLPQNVLKK